MFATRCLMTETCIEYFPEQCLIHRKCSIDICSLTSPTFTEQQRLPEGGGLWGKVFEGAWGALVSWYEETLFRKPPGCNKCSKEASVMLRGGLPEEDRRRGRWAPEDASSSGILRGASEIHAQGCSSASLLQVPYPGSSHKGLSKSLSRWGFPGSSWWGSRSPGCRGRLEGNSH